MGAGRKPKPDHLKAVQGTLRKDRTNENAPAAATDAPEPPHWMASAALPHFWTFCNRLAAIGLSSSSYTETIAEAATRVAEVEEANASIQREGMTYWTVDTKGNDKLAANPAVSQRSEALRHLQSLLAEMGLTPASIGKVSAPGGKGRGKGNPFEGM
jgi:P27 family predicted phage terminase small subunit